MNDQDSRGGSGSTAVVIAVVVAILLAVPCLLGVLLFGAGFIAYRTTEEYNTQVESLIDEPAAPPVAPTPAVRAEQDDTE